MCYQCAKVQLIRKEIDIDYKCFVHGMLTKSTHWCNIDNVFRITIEKDKINKYSIRGKLDIVATNDKNSYSKR